MDDDVLMDNEAVMRLLKKFPSGKNSILCRTFTSNVVTRHPKSKWYLSYKEYAGKTLSMYCQGMAYILSGDLIPQMHSNIQKVQYLWVS
ncbi:unnamed protein product [Anisakis simplex]|uniref:Hexosyltransferase n=1 Tax=Anisakis simplex TaxID=6269 RepID=A0A0M3JGG3_ANISI|nr:unnamed protein product [Anisakis simplex]